MTQPDTTCGKPDKPEKPDKPDKPEGPGSGPGPEEPGEPGVPPGVTLPEDDAESAQPLPPPPPEIGDKQPNIVFLFADNLGYGELACYGGGITRGFETPRLDKLAAEGLRLTNYNTETQCTPSRSCQMTGRFSMRSGTYQCLPPGLPDGLVLWEETIASLLSKAGYATAMYGKWHLGSMERRLPHNHGFDEWYGIPRTWDEANWVEDEWKKLYGTKNGWNPDICPEEEIIEGKKGETSKAVAKLDVMGKRTADAEFTKRAIEFMRNAKRPFYINLSFAQVHFPVVCHPEFDGVTGNGSFADSLAELDYRCGQIIDAIDELRIADETIVIFTSDNGSESITKPWIGCSGMWSGGYFTAMEGSLRTAFIMRWPGKVKAGTVSNEMIHTADLFPTFARIAGVTELPRHRAYDGIDQLDFFLGQQEKSNREGFVIYVANRLTAVKWRHWKMHILWQPDSLEAPKDVPLPYAFNLLVDPGERFNVGPNNTWLCAPVKKLLLDWFASLLIYPPIRTGWPDPYIPIKGIIRETAYELAGEQVTNLLGKWLLGG